MRIGNGEFWLGDCLERMAEIPDGSVDMILCDLPYGTTACKWDSVIPFDALWAHYWRVMSGNGAVVLTAAQPFTSALVMSQVDRFRYSWMWMKNRPTLAVHAKNRPMAKHEDVLVFCAVGAPYNPIMEVRGKPRKKGGSKTDNGCYGELRSTESFNNTYYPTDIIEISNASKRGLAHPTQKPVALFEYLIRTYTDPDQLVLDNCAGSGTTAIAAERTGRRWLCIEREPSYYYPAVGRVWGEINAQS